MAYSSSTNFPGTWFTVSPTGLANYQPPNNGANFGPDTPGTQTNGIQEALNAAANAGGGKVYCQAGAYTCSLGFWFPSSNILLEFAPGSSLTFTSAATGLTPNYATGAPFPGFIVMGTSMTANPSSPLSHQWLIGNGLKVSWNNQNIGGVIVYNPGQANGNSIPAYSGPGGEDYLVQGLETSGIINQVFAVGSDNGNSTMTALQHLRHVVMRGIYDVRGANTGGTGMHVAGGVAQVLVEDCESDLSGTTGDISNLFMNAASGDTSNVVWRRCRFKSNGSSGQVVELQGNGGSGTTGGTHEILLEDCILDSGATSGAPTGGSGGAYVDDNNGGSGIGYVYNLEFRRCIWVFCGMSFQSAGTQFGYLRFIGPVPGAFSGSLGGRGPDSSGVSISVGASPYSYQNLDSSPETVVVSGGSVSSIKYNGVTTGLTSGAFVLNPGDELTVTYSTAPTMTKIAE